MSALVKPLPATRPLIAVAVPAAVPYGDGIGPEGCRGRGFAGKPLPTG